jgi:DNA topoisomerase-1
VVVESPTKARTISGFLPAGYQVAASMGHIRDLPEKASEIPEAQRGADWARLGVNVKDDFQPLYVVPASKKKVVTELRGKLRDAERLILATDEDREGESIGWHLFEVLKPKVPVERIVFHEITPEAIRDALRHPRQVDLNLVRAQETRRILDRLVGYTVSPVLWKKIASGLSAGRVQSVAVALIVEREKERRAFRSGSYWDLKAHLLRAQEPFTAQLQSVGGKRVATGRDFDESTGRLIEGRGVLLLDEDAARALRARIENTAWTVGETEEKPAIRRPAAPFTTSTLQQEANRKLRLSARETMRIAQRLYEEGLITYMRTDSVNLSGQAIGAARDRIRRQYGEEYLSAAPRQYTTQAKGAQEAHEAIRPAGTEMRPVAETGLSGREAQLYEMIWKRTIASQMADARLTQISALIHADDAVFRAAGRRVDFPGFFRAYVEGSDDPEAALEDRDEPLPRLKKGDSVEARSIEAIGHETQPPARFTEASLVKMLENEGIGRPSTYASIIGTIIDRGYVELQANQLVPTYTAFAVTGLLENHFRSLVDTRFTARMEEELDEIARGDAAWLPYLQHFFNGPEGLERQTSEVDARIDPREASTVRLEGIPGTVRIGKFGPYVEVERDGAMVTASIPATIPPGDLTGEDVDRLLREKTLGPEVIGHHPTSGEPVFLRTGRFGLYVQLGEPVDDGKPRRASLPKGAGADDVTLEMALRLLSLPRMLGKHPVTGKPVEAGIGRFGPFVVHDGEFRSLTKGDDVYTIGFERALEILSQPKRTRSTVEPIREIGKHPADGEPISLFAGRYGPYVKHGDVNASLPREMDPDALSVAEAVELLAARAATAKKPARGRGGRASGAGKTGAVKAGTTRAGKAKSGSGTRAAGTAAAATKKATAGKSAAATKSPKGSARSTAAKSSGGTGAGRSSGRKGTAGGEA